MKAYLVIWILSYSVSVGCPQPTDPVLGNGLGTYTANAVLCYEQVEEEKVRRFDTEEEAKDFLKRVYKYDEVTHVAYAELEPLRKTKWEVGNGTKDGGNENEKA